MFTEAKKKKQAVRPPPITSQTLCAIAISMEKDLLRFMRRWCQDLSKSDEFSVDPAVEGAHSNEHIVLCLMKLAVDHLQNRAPFNKSPLDGRIEFLNKEKYKDPVKLLICYGLNPPEGYLTEEGSEELEEDDEYATDVDEEDAETKEEETAKKRKTETASAVEPLKSA